MDKLNDKKLLWISPYVPYDSVPHAGGKCENYYIKRFKSSGEFDIHLITLAEREQLDKIDLDRYGISYSVDVNAGGRLTDAGRKIYNIASALNPWHKNGHLIMSYEYSLLERMLKTYASSNTPDIVVLEWTGTLLFLPLLKSYFPKAYVMIIEEDVFFQGHGRKYKAEKNLIKKRFLYDIYKKGKSVELGALKQCDLITVYNEKDKALLVKNGIDAERIVITVPYYEMINVDKGVSRNHNILFYGAMKRPENKMSVRWIIDNIMPLLKDTDIELDIVGIADEEVYALESDRVHIRGFVEDVTPYFSESLCLVASLQIGAGIKIKVLEAMAAGMTVLTNDVGIEGIPAENGRDYYHCVDAKEYAEKIKALSEGKAPDLGDNAKAFMEENYNIEGSAKKLLDRITKEINKIGN